MKLMPFYSLKSYSLEKWLAFDYGPLQKSRPFLRSLWLLEDQLILLSCENPERPNEGEDFLVLENPEEVRKYLAQKHSKISLPEMARLLVLTENFNLGAKEFFITAWGYAQPNKILPILEALTTAPRDLQDWICEKSFSPQDLAPLIYGRGEVWLRALLVLKSLQATRSQSVPLLEIQVDLSLGDENSARSIKSLQDQVLQLQLLSLKDFQEKVFTLRNPHASSRDKDQRQRLLNVNWPPGVQAQFQRRGDQGGLEIKFFASSPLELRRQISQLELSQKEWLNHES